ncbi:hypothetical protein F7725_001199 [Dissostichus mawsoni]|uniref:C-type lectin domain-containing protein n=1 Tax=Dissostichus mawsoni TaxID=36200 RepID=A0A7J5ZGJ9_DISMA|nr:hypothetical protein F7725_001199 [Dissostichus mawsoni]
MTNPEKAQLIQPPITIMGSTLVRFPFIIHLLQVDLLVAVQQLRDVVTDDPHEEGDEDDGQDDPHPNAGVQQELWTGHRSLFNQPTRVWIGLYDDVDSWKWSMSDTSFFKPRETEFRQWASGEPNNKYSVEHCTRIRSNDGLWNDRDCAVRINAVCLDVRGLGLWSEETIHLLRTCACFNASDKGEGGEPNGVDLNDQAFLDEMLVEAKKNLRAQGLDDNVKLPGGSSRMDKSSKGGGRRGMSSKAELLCVIFIREKCVSFLKVLMRQNSAATMI